MSESTYLAIETAEPPPLNARSAEQLVERQRLLESEIEANEEENRLYQAELDQIYAEQDRRRDASEG